MRRSVVGRLGRVIYTSGLLIPLIFVLVVGCLGPLTSPHELDHDEGIELMKALLVSKGHPLYAEVWDDQPPVMTLVLAQWFKVFGPSLVASRVLVLLFSAVLIWAFYQTVRLGVSEPAALSAVALLLLASRYVRLSISVMIGLPAIALAMLSIYLLVVAQRGGRAWLIVVAGSVFGLSIQTKLFTVILVPVIVVYLCFLNESGSPQAPAFGQRLGRCGLWLGAMGAAFVATGILVGTFDPQSLIVPHLGEQTRAANESGNNLASVAERLSAHVGYLPLAVVGILWGLKRRIPTAALALGWLAVALASLLYQRPLLYHHFLLMTVPLAWLSAFGVEAGLRAFGVPDREPGVGTSAWCPRSARLFAILAVAGLMVFNVASGATELLSDMAVLDQNDNIVERLCPGGRSKPAWVFSDRPIYAFLAGSVIPPPVAVLSGKRVYSGELPAELLVDILRAYRPEYLVFERFPHDYSQRITEALGEDYGLLQEYYDHTTLVAQLFGAQPVNASSIAGARHDPSRVQFDDWLSLEWTPALLRDRAESGNCLAIRSLEWQRPTAHSGENLGISLRLVDQDGNVVAQHDEPLGTDFNTMRDRAEMPYFLNFLIPEGTPPGDYDLTLVVYDPLTGLPLEATGAAAAAGSGAVLGQVRVNQPAEAPAIRAALADFGPVRLITASTPATAVSAGDEVPLDLLWQADADHNGESFVVVAQLLDDQGKVVAGLEEEPLKGRYGTPGWQPGELVRDRHILTVPAGTRPGRYDLIVGLYRLPTRERLKTSAGFLGLQPQDHFLLRQIEVR